METKFIGLNKSFRWSKIHLSHQLFPFTEQKVWWNSQLTPVLISLVSSHRQVVWPSDLWPQSGTRLALQEEPEITCIAPDITHFHNPLIKKETRQRGVVIIHVLLAIFVFVGNDLSYNPAPLISWWVPFIFSPNKCSFSCVVCCQVWWWSAMTSSLL